MNKKNGRLIKEIKEYLHDNNQVYDLFTPIQSLYLV